MFELQQSLLLFVAVMTIEQGTCLIIAFLYLLNVETWIVFADVMINFCACNICLLVLTSISNFVKVSLFRNINFK